VATSKFMPAVRQADEPVTKLVAVPRRTIVLIVMDIKKLARAPRPGEFLLSSSHINNRV